MRWLFDRSEIIAERCVEIPQSAQPRRDRNAIEPERLIDWMPALESGIQQEIIAPARNGAVAIIQLQYGGFHLAADGAGQAFEHAIQNGPNGDILDEVS